MTSITTLATSSSSTSPPWLTAAVKLGVPSLIALFLVLWMTRTFSAQMDDASANVVATQRAVEQHVSDMKSDQAITRALLRAICYNAAKNDGQRATCEVGR